MKRVSALFFHSAFFIVQNQTSKITTSTWDVFHQGLLSEIFACKLFVSCNFFLFRVRLSIITESIGLLIFLAVGEKNMTEPSNSVKIGYISLKQRLTHQASVLSLCNVVVTEFNDANDC